MKKHLVLAGGGHAHMVTLSNLRRFIEKGHRVTVIQPSEHHYYSGMGPGMLGRTYTPDEIRFATRRVVEKMGGAFVPGRIDRIDADARSVHLESGDSIPYDVISCNVGSQVPQDMIAGPLDDIYLVKPIERLLDAQRSLRTRDYSRKRESEEGKSYQARRGMDLAPDMNEENRKRQEDLLKALKEGYSRDYRELIKRYFEAISRGTDEKK